MKMSMKTPRLVAGLGLAAGLMIGCQNLLNPDNSASTSGSANIDDGSGALSLSIKDDSACRGEWHSILEARTAGHPDSAADAARCRQAPARPIRPTQRYSTNTTMANAPPPSHTA